MAEMVRRFPLDGVVGAGVSPAGAREEVTLTARNGIACALVMARRERSEEVAAALGIAARPGLATRSDRFAACPTAPGRWLVLAEWGSDGGLAAALRGRVGAAGHVSEQSHGRQVVRIGGPMTREVLRRGCRLDLHPRVVGPDWCAETPLWGIGCLVHCVDAAPTFDLVVYAGYAEAFWHRLTTAAARFGYRAHVETFAP